LLKNIIEDEPEVIRIFSRDEHKQFELQQQWRHFTNIRYLIGDIREYERVRRAMQDIDYVFHCAAMKHVPACEYNPFEAVQTNVIGTQNVIQASIECKVHKTVFTSTDKAIAPTNTYGASKLMAERLVSAAQYYGSAGKTIFAAVRFGNIMGSRGSVIPLFQSQIKEKSAVTVTNLKMTRFMMTMQQATELLIKSMVLSKGGEIFVLKMPVIRLQDLVECVIEESARYSIHLPDQIRVEEIGLRPGEKMYEELMTEAEAENAIEFDDIFIIPNSFIRRHKYEGGKSAKKQSYNSHELKEIDKDKVKALLLDNNLFG